MNRHVTTWCLRAFLTLTILLAGCFPDNSLQWSADGAWGLFRAEGGLFLVEGATGKLTPVEPDGDVSIMPGISADGNHIAYVKGVACTEVSEGLGAFPPATTAMIRRDAEQLAQKVVAGLAAPDALTSDKGKPFDFTEPYYGWVLRTMVEDPEDALVEKLGPDVLAECRDREIGYCRLIVAPRDNPQASRTLTTLPTAAFRCRFSPDGRYIAYIAPDREDEEIGTLLVASVDGKTGALQIAKGVAVGYDWRPDSRALAYLKQDGDPLLGVVEEKVIVDSAGALLTELAADPATAPVGILRGAGEGKQLSGTLFQSLMKVQYGSAGRLFFSSPAVTIPTSDLDEPTYSLFCYDSVTRTVANVLPAAVSDAVGDGINFFSVSPDGTRVLLPMENNRFAIYTLGEKTPEVPLEETEAFGDGISDMLPAWRGNTQISCLVAGNSRFLGDSATGPEERNEIIVLNVEGDFHSHLSADWPDDIMP